MKEINIESILDKKFESIGLPVIYGKEGIVYKAIKEAMHEACNQAIDLASENATTCTNKESTSIIVNKESILKTKDQIK